MSNHNTVMYSIQMRIQHYEYVMILSICSFAHTYNTVRSLIYSICNTKLSKLYTPTPQLYVIHKTS